MSMTGSQGLKNAGKPVTVADILALLVGQDVSAASLTATRNAAGAIVLSGANGTLEINGANGAINLNASGGEYRITNKPVLFGSGTVFLRGLATDTGGPDVAVEIVNDEQLTTAGDLLLRIRNGEAGVGPVVFSIDRLGKQIYPTGGSADVAGIATLVGGTVTINTTAVTATSVILYARKTLGGTAGLLSVTATVAGTSFTITSASGTETSTISWMIIN